jgi:hemoglobin
LTEPIASDFERIGGEPGLRAVIDEFTATVFSDVMIGFLFDGKPKARIVEMEYRHAAHFLGADVVYNGRSIHEAHKASPIMGGHFMRRRKILENTLERHKVEPDIRERWLRYVDSLREDVLGPGQETNDCNHESQAKRMSGE